MFLGVDGGGTKTSYAVIDAGGGRSRPPRRSERRVTSRRVLHARPICCSTASARRCASGAIASTDLTYAFLGLPSYGEDSATTAQMDLMPAQLLDVARYRCGNDMLCSWAGSLACADGISVIAGTGSMAYGEYAGRTARAGGWGEIIGDEGSAYWIAREGMNLFSRMSDGRAARGPLYELVRARVRHRGRPRSMCAGLRRRSQRPQRLRRVRAARHEAARRPAMHKRRRSSVAARTSCFSAYGPYAESLQVPDEVVLPVSNTGGVFQGGEPDAGGVSCGVTMRGRRSIIGAAISAGYRRGSLCRAPRRSSLNRRASDSTRSSASRVSMCSDRNADCPAE